jgi:outer membrane lipoprotein-sorting protein
MNKQLIFLGVAYFTLPVLCRYQPESSRVSAADLQKKMRSTYADCQSYQDTGIVETISQDGHGAISKSRTLFKTYFARPNLFRFEWRQSLFPGGKEYQNIIWCDGTKTFTYWGIGKLDRIDSLTAAINANAGVSRGGSSTVPSMLITPNDCTVFNKLVEWTMVREEKIDNVTCYLIKAKHSRTQERVYLWVGKNDFLLRKLSRELGARGVSEERHDHIEIHHIIPKNLFTFKPSAARTFAPQ